MKKSLLLVIAVAGLLAGAGLKAARHGGGGHRGGGRHHGGWGHGGGWRRGGWGWGPGIGFGISVGGPGYYEPVPVVYIGNPVAEYWAEYPNARNYNEYKRWLYNHRFQVRGNWRNFLDRAAWEVHYNRRWH